MRFASIVVALLAAALSAVAVGAVAVGTVAVGAASEARPGPASIVAALEAEDARVRRAAASEAGWLDRTAHPDAAARLAPALARALDDTDAAVRRHAADALRALGAEAVEPLVAAFRQPPAAPEGPRRGAAAAREPYARALGELGPVAASAAPVLIDALVSAGSRWEATRLADAVGALGPAVAPGLLRALDERPGAREGLLRALTALGPEAGRAAVAPAVAILEEDPEARHRFSAALALGAFGEIASPAAPALLRALADDDNASVRMYAAQALGTLGRAEPEPAVRGLLAALQAGERRVASRAVGALGALGAPALEPTLAALAGSEDGFVREHAAAALREMNGAPAGPRIEGLLDALADPVKRVREAAGLALRGLGAPAVAALRPIAAGRVDGRSDPALRAWAALILGRMEPVPVEAAPELRVALRSEDGRLREAATWALGKLGPDAAEALPELVAALADDDPVVRRNAAWALGNAGRLAAEAAPRLEAVRRDDPDLIVREEADEALRKVRGDYAFDDDAEGSAAEALERARSDAARRAVAAMDAASPARGTAPAIPSVDDIYASGTRAAVLGPSGTDGAEGGAKGDVNLPDVTAASGPRPRGGSLAYDFRLTSLGGGGGGGGTPRAIRGSATLDLDGASPRWRAALEGDCWAGTLRRDGDAYVWEPLHGEPPAGIESWGGALLVRRDLRLGPEDGPEWIEVPAAEADRGPGWSVLHRADPARRAQVDALLWRDAWCPTEVRSQRLSSDGALRGRRLTVLRAQPGPSLPDRAYR